MNNTITLIKKEFLQIIRDSSSIMIAFVLPLIILILYRYAINLDTVKVTLGVKNDDLNPKISSLMGAFDKNNFIKMSYFNSKDEMYKKIINSDLKGGIIFPNDFTSNLINNKKAQVLIITDGSEANLANYVQNYSKATIENWLENSFSAKPNLQLITSDIRFWYNQDIDSHYFILPGSLAITMNMIGILLTALVISREWERGTIEALFCTKITKLNFILSKYIPYFSLGIISFIFNVFLCIKVFKIPFMGNLFILLFVGGLYLFCCLGVGLLISSMYKEQFSSSQMALSFGLLPALMLSGLIYPINSMPKIFQYLTSILPPRYFITFIQSEFMAGTIPKIVLINSIFLFILGLILFFAIRHNLEMRLEKCR
ncbi:MAG: ABC transporter permease [Candidatus Gastranaerophilales bacterium]|nr:ABC transporter permease [Candidatus Gastranaerophilales bacterium]